jgi:hypothetical protein
MKRVSLLLLSLTAAYGSEDIFRAFDPRPTPPAFDQRLGLEARWYERSAVRDGRGALAVERQQASAGAMVWSGGAGDEVSIDIRGTRTRIDGAARLPSGVDPVGEYHGVGAGSAWRRLLGGGHLAGATASVRGDGQGDDLDWSGTATAFTRIGLGEDGADGLLLALNYDTDRVFLRDVPVLPLAAWQGRRGGWNLVLGVPFSVVSWSDDDWRASAVIGPLPSASVERRVAGPLRVAAEARWTRLELHRVGRPDRDDRLAISQWEWSGGLRAQFGPAGSAEVMAGAATARRIGEDDDADDARRSGLALEPAAFVAVRGRLAF